PSTTNTTTTTTTTTTTPPTTTTTTTSSSTTTSTRLPTTTTTSSTATTTTTATLPNSAPPDCSAATAEPARLWPPNHKLVDVSIVGVTDPDGDPVIISVTGLTQDEPIGFEDLSNPCPDASGVGSSIARLRAERRGSGDGRGDQ